ncbi:MAG: TRAP transporter small permease subunit [Pseudomonadota bacterium]
MSGLMTVITFANVAACYGFNSNILRALEGTVFMFGWLVLPGASYAVKKSAHLGVDAIIALVSTGKLFGRDRDGSCRVQR